MESLAVVEMTIPNILAERYASEEMRQIWDPKNKIIEERKLWIAVMKAQSKLGLNIKDSDIQKYQEVLEKIDLDSIKNREKKTRHDVKARIEEFNSLAGLELIHIGMTSRDLTENVELTQILQSLRLAERQVLTLLKIFGEKAGEFSGLAMVGRSHNVPAQLTTLGKKFATFGEECIIALENLENLIERFALKGIRGPVGTAQDMLDVFLNQDAHQRFEESLLESTEITKVLGSTGQIYPRSIDFEVIAALVQLAAAPSNMAINIRLLAGQGLVSERFAKDQVGSSAMPHKMNPRLSERINGFATILQGYLSMVTQLVGAQWNEGDVSCSVVRRVAISDSFFAIDGLLQTSISVATDLDIFESAINRELDEQLPFISSSRFLIEAVKRGATREVMHKVIKTHATEALTSLRNKGTHDFIKSLGEDPNFPLSESELNRLIHEEKRSVGLAFDQCKEFSSKVKSILKSRANFLEFKPQLTN